MANWATKKAAKEGNYLAMLGSLLPQIDLSQYQPVRLNKDKERAKEWGFTFDQAGHVMHKESSYFQRHF